MLPDEKDVVMHFHSHLSDKSLQDAFTTHAHMCILVEEMQKDGMLLPGLTMWDDTNGCMKQYQSGNAMFLLSVLVAEYDIEINRAIGAPSHGKDVVDGLNATDKRFLKWLFHMIAKAKENEDQSQRKIAAHSMTDDGKFSLAKHAAEKLGHELRVAGVKSDAKYAKREGAAKVRKCTYHVQEEKNVMHHGIQKVATGFDKGPHNGVLGHCNIQGDPKLGIGKVAVQCIPCACVGC